MRIVWAEDFVFEDFRTAGFAQHFVAVLQSSWSKLIWFSDLSVILHSSFKLSSLLGRSTRLLQQEQHDLECSRFVLRRWNFNNGNFVPDLAEKIHSGVL